jgi:tRNA(adenine34) deaminase
MLEALAEARRAGDHGDVPVGAVAVLEGRVVGRGHNRREADCDPTAHAEMIALRQAAGAVGSVVELLRDPRLNHRVAVTRGVLADEAQALLSQFFAVLRGRRTTE